MAVSPEDLAFLRRLLSERAGFELAEGRDYLIENRLGPLVRREGFGSAAAVIAAARSGDRPGLSREVVEAMLPADSVFFRDRLPFRLFAEALGPALAAARPDGRLRVLSAGCGSGQEAWSLAMAAAEAGLSGVDILAIDLCARRLEKAKAGTYTQFEVQKGLRARQLIRWFSRRDDAWVVGPELRPRVQFLRANLLDDLPDGTAFDAIFCRQVLGDMDTHGRRRTLTVLDRALAADGCLFLGTDEGVGEAPDAFVPVAGRRGLYVKAKALHRRAA